MPAVKAILWREQIRTMGEIKGLLFWSGPRFDGAVHRAAVYGERAQLLAAFDAMSPLFEDMDIDV